MWLLFFNYHHILNAMQQILPFINVTFKKKFCIIIFFSHYSNEWDLFLFSWQLSTFNLQILITVMRPDVKLSFFVCSVH